MSREKCYERVTLLKSRALQEDYVEGELDKCGLESKILSSYIPCMTDSLPACSNSPTKLCGTVIERE